MISIGIVIFLEKNYGIVNNDTTDILISLKKVALLFTMTLIDIVHFLL